ncbi:MAG: bifunctional precorrin-2 dehydrogenase/sirohydrochlorin ferrochelatase [bacterium]|nr:bifunctional precorrin-2 dehydrogenase/sirohydrochlorin ferrochelatase [bacterium]
MRYFPINVDIQNKSCVLIGGGNVAYRKAVSLLKAGANIKLIAPEINEGVSKLVDDKSINWIKRCYEPGDLDGAALAIVAVDDPAVGEKVSEEAAKLNILINVADIPEQCTFTLSSCIERGDLLVTISTGGRCPAFSRHMRLKLEEIIDDSYGELLDLLGDAREKLLKAGISSDNCRDSLNKIIDSDIISFLREGEHGKAAAFADKTVSEAILKLR